MILGVDGGGTNVDAVLVDDDGVRDTAKVPHGAAEDRFAAAVDRVLDGHAVDAVDRAVVATTLVLNDAVQDRLPRCTSVLIPGVGLSPELARCGDDDVVLDGCVDHRGRVTEELDGLDALDDVPDDAGAGTVAVTAKFATRNPALERETRSAIDVADHRVALGSEAGGRLGFPARARTTALNARAKPGFEAFAERVQSALDAAGVAAPTYFLKGDAAMLGRDAAVATPAHTLRSGPAASTLGLLALTGAADAVCVDVGGTTTDLTVLRDGYPVLEGDVAVAGHETFYDGVGSLDLAVGGDTRVDADGLTGERVGDAAAFGGPEPTPTDALHVLGACDIGDGAAAREALATLGDPETVAEDVVEEVLAAIADGVEEITATPRPPTMIVGGVLAPFLADPVGDRLDWIEDVVVPEHADVAGAVGCAAARVSVATRLHVDTARGTMTVTAAGGERTTDVEQGRTYDDADVEALVTRETREATARAGGDPDATIDVSDVRRFNVVEGGRVEGEIVDATAQATPGLIEVFQR